MTLTAAPLFIAAVCGAVTTVVAELGHEVTKAVDDTVTGAAVGWLERRGYSVVLPNATSALAPA